MPLTTSDFDRVVRKLEMRERVNKHRFVFFEHEGKQVLFTERSHGRGELGRVEYAIRKQLMVGEREMRGLVDCWMSRDAYIEHLKKKGAIR